LLEIEHDIASEQGNFNTHNYLKRKAELQDELKSADRKTARYETRERIVEAVKIKNMKSLRVSYLDLLMSVFTKTCRGNQFSFVQELEKKYGSHKVDGVKSFDLKRSEASMNRMKFRPRINTGRVSQRKD
jgi:hypothetical protein